MNLSFESGFQTSVELSKYISDKKLQENRENYTEFTQELSLEDEMRLRLIQQRLSSLPLVHCSRNPRLTELTTIHQQSETNGGNTYQLDRSLGLDHYIFLHWGLGDWSQYGQNLYCYPSQLLLEPTTIVSPFDVLNIAIGQEGISYEQTSAETKDRLKKYYFDLMLSGQDWFHLITLRVLNQLKQGFTMIPITEKTFGEVKILNRVNAPVVATYHGRSEIENKFYGEQMYPNGFIFKNIYDNLKLRIPYLVDPEPTPEQVRQLEQAWEAFD